MTTERTFTADQLGGVNLDTAVGKVIVSADPKLTRAMVVVRTSDDTGPSADAVNDTRAINSFDGTLSVRVPAPTTPSVTIGRSQFNFGGGVSGLRVVQHIDSIPAGTRITGMTIGDDGITFAPGSKVSIGGTVISGGSEIEVLVFLPTPAAMRLTTTAARLKARGDLDALIVTTVSGDVDAESVAELSVGSVSGHVTVGRLRTMANVSTVSGAIEIDQYAGRTADLNSTSGAISVIATSEATGAITAATISGGIDLRGAAHLNVRASTVNGRKTIH